MRPKDVVLSFWKEMNSNNFHNASSWLSENFECQWPQSNEKIVGRSNFAELNSNYPSIGQWKFSINSIVVENDQVVTDVSVSDGSNNARAITFHTVRNDLIQKQIEFWPDSYEAPVWRKQWVQKL